MSTVLQGLEVREVSNEIKSLGFIRSELKTELSSLLREKNRTERSMELQEAYLEKAVLSNVELKNEAQRKNALKIALLEDQSFQTLVSIVDEINTKIEGLELDLRRNQIEISFQEREFQILTSQA